MPVETKVYKKQYSFTDFVSNLGTDIDFQRQRAVNILKSTTAQIIQPLKNDILKDLSHANGEGDFKVTPYIADELTKLEDELVPRYLFHRYRYDVFPRQQKLDAYPPYLQIEPSSVCNYRCVFCYQTDLEWTSKASNQMGRMTLNMFRHIVDEIEGKVDLLSLASRGEPMLCKDIDQMLEYCVNKFLGLKINTNASMLTEANCHAILAGGVNTLVFSADAAQEPLYSQLRVKGNLEKVLKNVRMFKHIREKHYPGSRIITRVSGVRYGDGQDMDSMVGCWGDLVDQVAFVKYNPWESVYNSPINDLATPCSDLWRRMFVWFDGKVNPCDTDYKSTLSVGNLKEKNVSTLWRSEAYDKLRQAHVENQRGKTNPCRRCTVI